MSTTMTHWQRISATEYRLDDVWTVRCRDGGWWTAWRGDKECLASYVHVNDAMLEAVQLRKEDEAYR